MAWTTPRDWTDGELVTEALLDTHLRDNLLALTTWASYTPTWTATGTAPSIGNGTLTGWYIKAGNLCHCALMWQPGSTTTFGTGSYKWSLPVAATQVAMGSCRGYDASPATVLMGFAAINAGSGTVEVYSATASAPALWAQTAPITWASGDYLHLSVTYQC